MDVSFCWQLHLKSCEIPPNILLKCGSVFTCAGQIASQSLQAMQRSSPDGYLMEHHDKHFVQVWFKLMLPLYLIHRVLVTDGPTGVCDSSLQKWCFQTWNCRSCIGSNSSVFWTSKFANLSWEESLAGGLMIGTITIRIPFGEENEERNGWNIITFSFKLFCAHMFAQNNFLYVRSLIYSNQMSDKCIFNNKLLNKHEICLLHFYIRYIQ